MNKTMIAIVMSMLGVVLLPQVVAAHVLVSDETQQTGVILHIIPDDDPIAGESAELFFDVQSQQLDRSEVATKLVVTDETGVAVTVPTHVTEKMVSARYVFPRQGMYSLVLTVTSHHKTYVFSYSQRISRGETVGSIRQPHDSWAEGGMIVAVVGSLVVLIAVTTRWSRMMQQSHY